MRPEPRPRRSALRERGRPGRPERRARSGVRSGARCGRRGAARPRRRRARRSPGRGCAVGSSRITSGASRRNARARAIRWGSPAESGAAAFADQRVVPVGEPGDERIGACELGRVPHPLVVGRRRRRAGCCPRPCRGTSSGVAEPRRSGARQAAGSQAARSTVPAVTRPRGRLDERAGGARRSCSCLRRLGRRAPRVSPGASSRSTLVEHARPRVRDR